MNLLPPFVRKFGMIPESYKLAMTYEEQLLWLCKHLEDFEGTVAQAELDIDSLTNLVNSFDERITGNTTAIIDLQAGLNNLGNVVPITLLSPNLVITDNNVDLEEGYYYTGNCQVVSSNTTPNTVYIDTNTYFYFNPTGGSGFTPIFKVFSDKDNLQAISYTVEYSGGWQRIEFNTTTSISSSSTNTQIPTALAVKNYVDSHSSPSVVKTLNDDLLVNAGIYEPQEGVYYTGSYVIKYYNTDPLIPAEYITIVPTNTLCVLDYSEQTIEILNYPQLPEDIRRYYSYYGGSWHLTNYTINENITKFTANVTLTSGTVPVNLTQGLYYTGNYKLINTDSSDIFPQDTLFFYNSTNNEFLKLTNTTFSSQIGSEYWRYLDYSNLWYKLDYKTTGTVDSNSTSTQIPTAEGVYRAIQNFVNGNGNTSSVINTIWTGTETEYNNIVSPDSNTLYFIDE